MSLNPHEVDMHGTLESYPLMCVYYFDVPPPPSSFPLPLPAFQQSNEYWAQKVRELSIDKKQLLQQDTLLQTHWLIFPSLILHL